MRYERFLRSAGGAVSLTRTKWGGGGESKHTQVFSFKKKKLSSRAHSNRLQNFSSFFSSFSLSSSSSSFISAKTSPRSGVLSKIIVDFFVFCGFLSRARAMPSAPVEGGPARRRGKRRKLARLKGARESLEREKKNLQVSVVGSRGKAAKIKKRKEEKNYRLISLSICGGDPRMRAFRCLRLRA